MFGKKAARIRELEEQLVNAMENLSVAEVPVGMGKLITPVAHIVSRGKWYRVSYDFRADGVGSFDIADLYIAETDPRLDQAGPARYMRFGAGASR